MALGFMRRHRRWLFVFLWLVIGAFIILYIPAFQGGGRSGSGDAIAGTVGGMPITAAEFQRDYLRRRQMYERLRQGRLDPAMLKRLGLDNQVFEGLVIERLVQLETARLGLSVSDGEVEKWIAEAPQFQREGHFIGGPEIKRLLEMQGMTVDEFEEGIRSDLLRSRLESLVTDGVSVTPAEAEREFRRRNEQVKLEYVMVNAAAYRSQVSVSDADVKARFDAKKDAYKIPEQRVVSYILVDADALRSRVAITDPELEAYYQEHKDEFQQPEQVCASHILVKVRTNAQDAEGHTDDEAHKIAAGLLARIKAGADLAALAKTASEDKGTAENGGDLGCFPRGRMVQEFDNAVFSLGPGATSDLVKTAFGYHIIRVTSHQEESVPPLSQVKERIRGSLMGQRLAELSDAKVEAVAMALRGGKSLDEAARVEALTVAQSAPFGRGDSPEPIASPDLVASAFGLKANEVDKEPYAVPRGYAFIALAQVKPPRVPDFNEVKERVKADLEEERALDKARSIAADLKTRAESGGLEKAAAALGLVRKETSGLVGRGQPLGDLESGAAVEEVAFGLSDKALSDPVRVHSGYAVLRALDRKPFDPAAFEKQKPALMTSLRAERKGQLFQAYVDGLRQKYVVERRPEVIRRVVG